MDSLSNKPDTSVQDWNPHMSFIWRVGSYPRRQPKNIEMKYKFHIKPVHELCGTCIKYNVKN